MHKNVKTEEAEVETTPAEYQKALGDAVKRARGKTSYTQADLAELAGMESSRTILNIENYRGNPLLENLYPLIRALKIDPRDIFYPEVHRDEPSLRQLRILVEECSEEEAKALIPVLESLLNALRDKNAMPV